MNLLHAFRVSLFALFVSISGIVAGQSAVVEGTVLEGLLTVLHGDPNPATGGPSRQIYILNGTDGRIELDMAGSGLSAETVRSMINKRIQVITESPPSAATEALPRARVRAMRSLGVSQLKISGNQPFVSILCRFGGNTAEPRPPAYFLTQLGTVSPGFNHYFREVSYATLTLDGSAVTPAWVEMPKPRSFYLDGKKTSAVFLDELFRDCTNAAVPVVDFKKYFGINLMFNDALDGAAWGGGNPGTLGGVEKVWPATWMPYLSEADDFGWRRHGILAHEMAHAFGAPHSESPDGDEYGSQWDVVSSPGAECGITDPNYGCIGQSMNAYAKSTMGILAANRQQTHAAGTQTYTIERLEQPPTTTSTVMLRIAIAGTTSRFYTVESRYKIGYDAQLPGQGVIIHVVDTTKDRPARLVVPGGGNGKGLGGIAAVWLGGSTFSSTADNVSINIASISADGTARVTVTAAGTAVAVTGTVVEYYNPDLKNYFITSDPAEQAAVDSGAAGRWQRTGNTFAAGGPNKVCRFYGNSLVNPATGAFFGPNSHFYTADPGECEGLKAQYTPTAKSWKFESNDFLTTIAINGACAAGLVPVYRAYNNGFTKGIDSNHRITTNLADYQGTVAAGYSGEGIVMCAPPKP